MTIYIDEYHKIWLDNKTMESEYIKRSGTGELVARLEERFVGETLFRAAEFLADIQDIDLADLLASGRPLNFSANRPDNDMNYEYEFIVCADDDNQEAGPGSFEYILQRSETEIQPLGSLSDDEKQSLSGVLESEEEPDEDLLYVLGPDVSPKLQDAVSCSKEYITYYRCSQQALAIMKNTETNYYINGDKIMTVGFADEAVTENGGIADENATTLLDIGMDLSIIEPEDIDLMREILYYLNLPGGMLTTEITTDFVDDNRVVR